MTPFGQLEDGRWFILNGHVHHKLKNLNGSNAYKLYAGFVHVCPSREVKPIQPPIFNNIKEPKKNVRAMITLNDDYTWKWGVNL